MLEEVVAGSHTLVHAGSDGPVTGFFRRIENGNRQPGGAAHFDEAGSRDLFARLRSAAKLERFGADDPLR